MYPEFYGFSERPFDVSPDPKFLYLTESHREALASMLYGIKEKRGFLAVTGEVGTGKTTLVQALLNSLHENVKTVHIFRRCTTFPELLRTLLYELGVPYKGRDRLALWQRLDEYLLETASKGETVVLIIDEAQNLGNDMLEEVRTLSNLETQKTKLLQIILVGQPELETKLNSDELRQLRQRIAVRRKLLPLPHARDRGIHQTSPWSCRQQDRRCLYRRCHLTHLSLLQGDPPGRQYPLRQCLPDRIRPFTEKA